MTTSSPRDPADLREKAETARDAWDGGWRAGDTAWSERFGMTYLVSDSEDRAVAECVIEELAEHVAAASPDRILALIEHVEALEAQVERVRALHVRREAKVYEDQECAENICDHDGPCFLAADAVCAHCADQTEPGGDWEHLVRPDAFWPCATVRALAPQPAATEEERRVSYYDTVRAMHPSPELLAAVDAAEAKDAEAGAGGR